MAMDALKARAEFWELRYVMHTPQRRRWIKRQANRLARRQFRVDFDLEDIESRANECDDCFGPNPIEPWFAVRDEAEYLERDRPALVHRMRLA
jgi:hypothetical protein